MAHIRPSIRPSGLYTSALERSEEGSTLCYREESGASSTCVMLDSMSVVKTAILHDVVHQTTVRPHSTRIVRIASVQSHLRHPDR